MLWEMARSVAAKFLMGCRAGQQHQSVNDAKAKYWEIEKKNILQNLHCFSLKILQNLLCVYFSRNIDLIDKKQILLLCMGRVERHGIRG